MSKNSRKQKKYDWVDRFPFGGHQVFVGGARLDGGLAPLINKWVQGREPNYGQAQVALLYQSLETVKVDEGEYAEWHNARGEGGSEPFPFLVGDDGETTLAERLIEDLVTKRYPFVLKKWPKVFEEFLPEEDDDDYELSSSSSSVRPLIVDPTGRAEQDTPPAGTG